MFRPGVDIIRVPLFSVCHNHSFRRGPFTHQRHSIPAPFSPRPPGGHFFQRDRTFGVIIVLYYSRLLSAIIIFRFHAQPPFWRFLAARASPPSSFSIFFFVSGQPAHSAVCARPFASSISRRTIQIILPGGSGGPGHHRAGVLATVRTILQSNLHHIWLAPALPPGAAGPAPTPGQPASLPGRRPSSFRHTDRVYQSAFQPGQSGRSIVHNL